MAEGSYGGFWIRFLATLVDGVILFPITLVLAAGLAFVGDLGAVLIGPIAMFLPIAYYAVMQASARQATFGKSLLGMKVATVSGERISMLRSFGRELAKIVSYIPLMLGFLLAVGLMVALWVPLFFFDYKAEKKRGAEPIGSGENPPTAPLDKVHLD